jgi:ABC-type Na+ efflux pump permease subunit
VTSLIYFLLTFALVTSGTVQVGWGGQVFRNSPYTVALNSLIMVVWAVFILVAFVANVVLRDEETGFGPIIYATRLSKFDYLFGRFAGAFGAGCLAFLSVPLAIMVGSAMPWLDPQTIGPFRLSDYLYAYFVLCVPTLFIMGAGFFALATATRSIFATYIAALVVVVLYIITTAHFSRPEFAATAALLDPYGLSAFTAETRTWTPSERNTLLPSMTGALLTNRLVWLTVAFALLAVAWRAFRREGRSVPPAREGRASARPYRSAAPARPDGSAAPSQRQLGWGPLVALTRFDVRSVVRSPAYPVMLGIAVLTAVIGLWMAGDDSVSVIYPVTRVMIQTLIEQFTVIPLVIPAYYAGELVWRDRDRGMHEVIDATPASDVAFVVPKIVASAVVLFSMALVSVVAAIGVQALKGYTNFELGHYLVWYLLPWLLNMVLYAVLAVFVQTLVPHKFVGLLVMLLFIVAR